MSYQIRRGWVKAVDNASIFLDEGHSLGIVGESGCGKTSLAASIMRLLPPNGRITEGSIDLEGTDILRVPLEEFRRKYRWKKISMIYQSSMNALNPVFRIRKQFLDTIRLHEDVTREEAADRMSKILELVGLHASVADNYPHELSGGMRQRVVIGLSLLCNPRLLIADEPTTALDVVVQDQILEEIKQLQKKLNISLMMISHDISVIFETCEKMAVMYGGRVVEYAESVSLYRDPRHPYAAGLLRSFPSIRGRLEQLISIPGSPPDLETIPKGCVFQPRCKFAQPICREKSPPLVEVVPGEHYSLCHFAKEAGFEW